MPFGRAPGIGVQLRVIVNENGPNPSPPTDGRRQSQTSAASARRCPPCKEPVRADLRPVVTSHVLLELAVSSRRRPWQQPRPSWFDLAAAECSCPEDELTPGLIATSRVRI